jgi:cytochrome bd ubiquinol oxidase subunit II
MPVPDLEIILAGVLLIALTLYVLLGGADFGAGILELLARGPRGEEQRDLISNAIGPIWEANHVWLILVIVLLFTVFPLAFVSIMTALFLPLMLLLIGIVLRGATFTFLLYDTQTKPVQQRWGGIFAITSILTPLMLGVTLGAVMSGDIRVQEGVLQEGAAQAWLAPFPWALGIMIVAIFAYLAAVYLALEAETRELQDIFRRRALILGGAVFLMGGVVFVLMTSGAPRILEGLSRSPWAIPLHLAALLAAGGAALLLWKRQFYLARLAAIAEVVLIIWGWGAAQYPYLVEPNITIFNAAAPAVTLRLVFIALVVGSFLLFPSVYYLLRIFKGAKADIYRAREEK